MSWFKTGWGDVNEEGSKSPFESKGPRRFWLPPEKSARLLFLDDDPTGAWEHGFNMNGKWGHHEFCLTKNKLGERCPICDSGDKMWPYFIGFFTVINLTPWFTKKDNKEICLTREVFGARMGSKEKPGILKKIERMKASEGRLKGCIYEAYRSGKKTESVGDEFKLVEKIDISEIEKYGRAEVEKYAKRINEKVAAKDAVSVEKLLERNPWRPINFEKLFETDWKPRLLAELDRLFARGGAASGGGDGSGDSAGGGGDSGDDDIPY